MEVAFAAGGLAASMAVHALAPAHWNEPLVAFLVGGNMAVGVRGMGGLDPGTVNERPRETRFSRFAQPTPVVV